MIKPRLPDHIALDIHYAKAQVDHMADRYDYAILEDDMLFIFKRFIYLPKENAVTDVLTFLGSLTYLEEIDVSKTINEACQLVKDELTKVPSPIYQYRLDAISDDWALFTRDDLEELQDDSFGYPSEFFHGWKPRI